MSLSLKRRQAANHQTLIIQLCRETINICLYLMLMHHEVKAAITSEYPCHVTNVICVAGKTRVCSQIHVIGLLKQIIHYVMM